MNVASVDGRVSCTSATMLANRQSAMSATFVANRRHTARYLVSANAPHRPLGDTWQLAVAFVACDGGGGHRSSISIVMSPISTVCNPATAMHLPGLLGRHDNQIFWSDEFFVTDPNGLTPAGKVSGVSDAS